MKSSEAPGRHDEKDVPEKGQSGYKKTVRIILIGIFAVGLIVSGITLLRYYSSTWATESGVNELRSSLDDAPKPPSPSPVQEPENTAEPEPTERIYEISERFVGLHELNSDFAGWVKIDGTRIDYPVMFTPEDSEYYLNHNFYGEIDSNGLPFLDGRCAIAPKSQVQIIYGHNIRSGIMFHNLTLYTDEEFWREHQFIQYDTVYDEAVYQIVAAFVFDVWNTDLDEFQFNRFTRFSSERRFNAYKEEVLERALYDTGLEFGWEDQYLILATCEYTAKNGRFVLLAKLVTQDA